LGYIDSGIDEGAQLLYQSHAPDPIEGGSYVPFTIFDQVSSHHKIAREEVFGPVLSILSFDMEETAIRMANETVYGLSAILWTRDTGRAHRVSQGINAGWVTVNATGKPSGGPAEGVLFVGGHKNSGLGGEGGIEGLESYTSATAVQLFV
jgi:acyl-CoA reductase-like NAD-dependent aldehyde dehydrogenase